MKTQLHSPAAADRRARALAHLLARQAGFWAALVLSFAAGVRERVDCPLAEGEAS